MGMTPLWQRIIPILNRAHEILKASCVDRDKAEEETLPMLASVYDKIKATVGVHEIESGGMLGGSNGIITNFHFDSSASCTSATYIPDISKLNHLLLKKWEPSQIDFMGFIHSHPQCSKQPSAGDLVYGERILNALTELDRIYLPIVVFTNPDADDFEIRPFVLVRNTPAPRLKRLRLQIIPEKPEPPKNSNQLQEVLKPPPDSVGDTFSRVQKAYDLPHLAKCRLVVIGVGGAAGWVVDMARAGVGQFVLIDPDTFSATNLATQAARRSDIGRLKVDCVAERILDINPRAQVLALPHLLDDFNDSEFKHRTFDPIDGVETKVTLLCGCSDNFWVQGRLARLTLQFGLPSLSAQVWAEGRGAEISFTHPGTTAACQRCCLQSRYGAYIEEGYKNQVGSNGTPIFSTARLNSLKGFIALALLHHNTDHPRWGGLLKKIGNRNLVLLRMDPDFVDSFGLPIFDQVFEGAGKDKLLFDEAIWLPQLPAHPDNDSPLCPDCKGTGNLLDAKGTFSDTRLIKKEPA